MRRSTQPQVLFGISDCTIPAFQESLRELSRICGTEKSLPESCMLSDSLLVVGLDPSASGGVYEGTFDGSKVHVRRINPSKKFERHGSTSDDSG
jgi:hypothetical protein